MERLLERLADHVPAGDLDRTHRGEMDGVRRQIPGAVHAVPEGVDGVRFLADDQGPQLLERAEDRPGRHTERRLAVASQPGIRIEGDENPVLPWIADHDDAQVTDPHCAISKAGRSMVTSAGSRWSSTSRSRTAPISLRSRASSAIAPGSRTAAWSMIPRRRRTSL